MRRIIYFISLFSLSLLLFTPSTKSATLIVSNSSDTNLNCGLREAITSINSASNQGCTASGSYGTNDEIILTNGTTYTLSLAGANEDLNSTGDLDIKKTVKIYAPSTGDPAIIEQTTKDRVLHLITGDLNLENTTVKGGYIDDSSGYSSPYKGAGIATNALTTIELNSAGLDNNSLYTQTVNTNLLGGGLYVEGDALIDKTFITSNEVIQDVASGTGVASGAGVHLAGTSSVSIENSLIALNIINSGSLSTSTATSFSRGAGLACNASTVDLTLLNSTISANENLAYYPIGAGLYNKCDVYMSFSTVSDNSLRALSTSGKAGSAFYLASGTFFSKSNIFADNTHTGSGTAVGLNGYANANTAYFTTQGDNYFETNSKTGASQTYILTNTSLNDKVSSSTSAVSLDLPTDNGGETQTVLINTTAQTVIERGSCEYNHGSGNITLNTDQRGAPRDSSETGDCDKGAYELNSFYVDTDADGYGFGLPSPYYRSIRTLNATDCNDTDASINPGASEICDGVDNDCDGNDDNGFPQLYFLDADSDNFGDINVGSCQNLSGYVSNSGDCDDSNSLVSPLMIEACNTVDDNCDGTIDESSATSTRWYQDSDGDGFGNASVSLQQCSQPTGYVSSRIYDCDDTNANIKPTAQEVCDSVDNDCDAQIDESVTTTFYYDADRDHYTSGVTIQACSAPTVFYTAQPASTTILDCNDMNMSINPGATEICDTRDNDCDGSADEAGATGASTWYVDTDGDGYGQASTTTLACSQPTGYVSNNTDCNDASNTTYPSALESCNSIDDDCDGTIDEGVKTTYYYDGDWDRYTSGLTVQSCSAPSGNYISNPISTTQLDCNDNSYTINPGATETCGNTVDENCDGSTGSQTWYYDADGDGYGRTNQTLSQCGQPAQYSALNTDCNDASNTINPNATEYCDDIDNNCNGVIDETGASGETSWYRDFDGDGFGHPDLSTLSCSQPDGFTADNTDCNDVDPSINTSASEVCDLLDNDCDGSIDQAGALGENTWYADNDGDGFGDSSSQVINCSQPTGYVSNDTDCNDANSAINPNATEVCSGNVDDNCDGVTDIINWYVDTDNDGFGSEGSSPIANCTSPGNSYTALVAGDCDDTSSDVNPNAFEHCSDLNTDNDCDGITDDADDLKLWFIDQDGDGYASLSATEDQTVKTCDQLDGYALLTTDCDDTQSSINPDAVEVCGGNIDLNCDGTIEGACPAEAECGNGKVEEGEECDDGVSGSTVCSTSCETITPVEGAECGNGLVETGEECDEGSASDTCTANCKTITVTDTPVCGNDVIESGEECDGGDTCSSDCKEISDIITDPDATTPKSSGGGCSLATTQNTPNTSVMWWALFVLATFGFVRQRSMLNSTL